MAENTVRSRYVMAGGVRTHYSEGGGNGPPLVGLHGGGAGSSGMAGFGKLMSALGQRFTVYALDSVGGYGDTDTSAPVPYGTQSRVDHLADFMDVLCLDDVCMVGNSQGAWAAARYAIMHPDRVKKLCYIGSATIAGAMGLEVPPSEGMRVLRSYDGTKEAMRRLMDALTYDKSAVTDELVEARQNAASRPGAAEARQAFQEGTQRFQSDPRLGPMAYDMRDTLPKLPTPSIFIWGENDTFALPEMGRELEKALPNIPFHWVPKAGHQAQTDQPEMVAKILIDFFTS